MWPSSETVHWQSPIGRAHPSPLSQGIVASPLRALTLPCWENEAWKTERLHGHGIQGLTKLNIYDNFEGHKPMTIDMLDECSCNVAFEDPAIFAGAACHLNVSETFDRVSFHNKPHNLKSMILRIRHATTLDTRNYASWQKRLGYGRKRSGTPGLDMTLVELVKANKDQSKSITKRARTPGRNRLRPKSRYQRIRVRAPRRLSSQNDPLRN